MKRHLTLSEQTQVLMNGLIDLKEITDTIYTQVRILYSPDDSVSDGVGDDVLNASNELSSVIENYIRRGIQDSVQNLTDYDSTSVSL